MANDNTSQHSGYKRTYSSALYPQPVNKKKYSPIANHDVPNYVNINKVDMDHKETTNDMASSQSFSSKSSVQSSWKDRIWPSKDPQNTVKICEWDHSYCSGPNAP